MKILNQTSPAASCHNTPASSPRICFQVEQLEAGYQKKPFTDPVSFSVPKGSILVLIGPNGSGKSTLLKTIAGQIPAVSGNMKLNGRPLPSFSRKEKARKIAVMMTEPLRTELMTGREVVEAGRYPYTGSLGILSSQDHEKVNEALKMANVTAFADQNFMSLSDGQRQRILLARAIAQEPELLIMDEPASYLDLRWQLELLEIVRTLCRQRKTSVIMSLHELFLVKKIADQILCIKSGKIERIGTAEEIFSNHFPDQLYDLPSGTCDSLFTPLTDDTSASKSSSVSEIASR